MALKLLLATLSIAVGLVMPAYADNQKDCRDIDPDVAIRGCTALINQGNKTDQGLAPILRNRALGYIAKRQYDLALADLTRAIKLDPLLAPAYYARGLAWSSKHKYDLAVADFDKAIELDPNLSSVDVLHFERGNAYTVLGEYDLAIADYDLAIKLNTDHADAYNARGFVLLTKADYDNALADFDKAIELDPKLADAYNGRGDVYLMKGQNDRAITNYNKAIELNPKLAVAYYHRALADHDRAIELDPELAKRFGNLFSDPSMGTHFGDLSAFTSRRGDFYTFSVSARALTSMCAIGLTRRGEEWQQAKGYCIGFVFAVLTELEREGKACFPSRVDSAFGTSLRLLAEIETGIAPFSWDVLEQGLGRAFPCAPQREESPIREAHTPRDDCILAVCE